MTLKRYLIALSIASSVVGFNYENGKERRKEASIGTSSSKGKVDYSGTQLWSIEFSNSQQRDVVKGLVNAGFLDMINEKVTQTIVLVQKIWMNLIEYLINKADISYRVEYENLQEAFDRQNPPIDENTYKLNKIEGHNMTWDRYHRHKDIVEFLDFLAKTYPKLCHVTTIGRTYEGRDIKLIKISNGKPGNRAIFIDGGIHAMEWISPSTVTYFINHLVLNFDKENYEIQHIDWHILPVANPDGYEYSHTTDQMWRKNRRNNGDGSMGVDLNRNFEFKWGGEGSLGDSKSPFYRGPKAFSEPESIAVSRYILNTKADFRAYITYHSYGQNVLFPYGYAENALPADVRDLEEAGVQMAEAIKKSQGSSYSVLNSARGAGPGSGGSDDWAKAVSQMKYSYTIELAKEFIPSVEAILPVARESVAGLRAMAKIVAAM